jgi:hypothetical protein
VPDGDCNDFNTWLDAANGSSLKTETNREYFSRLKPKHRERIRKAFYGGWIMGNQAGISEGLEMGRKGETQDPDPFKGKAEAVE